MHKRAWTGALVLSIGLLTASTQAGQIRRQGQGGQTVPVTTALKIGSDSYNSSSAGACTHAAAASIYGVASQMWTVRQEADGRPIQLTLWRPTDGSGDMFTFSASGPKSVQVSTVRGGQLSGSGSVKLQPAGKGGTFTIDAKARGGDVITGTIRCDAFTTAVAEGG